MEKIYDVIIVGTGAAGLYGALKFDESVRVLVISKRNMSLSNSSLAQGGVAAVLDKSNDNFKLHIADTLIAGRYKNNPAAIEVLVTEGPQDVLNLKKLGVAFDIDEFGELKMTLEAGHSRHRIVHHKDSTGRAIVDVLIENVKKHPNIDIVEDTMLYELKKIKGGFAAYLLKNGQCFCINSRYCILATGGIGRVYTYTTNSEIATGDGIAIAHRLGAKIKNLSWIQFHPTAFAAKKEQERFLISEAVRGEGAVLLNCNGRRFMFDYDKRGELAPRDIVSRAIMIESEKTNSERFYLDITGKDPEFIKNRFPMIYERCLEDNVDITKDSIPVFPCQHYLMGGIDVDLYARSSINGLYAVGECSHTGVHGANRLASNSLLEALVFSRRAAEDIMSKLQKRRTKLSDPEVPRQPLGIEFSGDYRNEIMHIMQSAYFVLPTPDFIPEGLGRVEEILGEIEQSKYKLTMDLIEVKSLATVAFIILKELYSRGKE